MFAALASIFRRSATRACPVVVEPAAVASPLDAPWFSYPLHDVRVEPGKTHHFISAQLSPEGQFKPTSLVFSEGNVDGLLIKDIRIGKNSFNQSSKEIPASLFNNPILSQICLEMQDMEPGQQISVYLSNPTQFPITAKMSVMGTNPDIETKGKWVCGLGSFEMLPNHPLTISLFLSRLGKITNLYIPPDLLSQISILSLTGPDYLDRPARSICPAENLLSDSLKEGGFIDSSLDVGGQDNNYLFLTALNFSDRPVRFSGALLGDL
jgi:hypothetical protein